MGEWGAVEGKDTVGLIIKQWLLIPYAKESNLLNDGEEIEFIKKMILSKSPLVGSGWQIKKWVDSLRKVAGILLNCNPELFEDRDFKNMTLEEAANKGLISKEFIKNL